jgi:hypothetical protein
MNHVLDQLASPHHGLHEWAFWAGVSVGLLLTFAGYCVLCEAIDRARAGMVAGLRRESVRRRGLLGAWLYVIGLMLTVIALAL